MVKTIKNSKGKLLIDVFDKKIFSDIKKSTQTNLENETRYAIFIVGQLRTFCASDDILNGINFLVDELKLQNKKPVIFFNVNFSYSHRGSEWHYRKLINQGLVSNMSDAEAYLSKFNCKVETFNEKLRKIKCDYRFNTYSDDDFVSNGKEMFFGNVDCFSFLNEYGKTLFHGSKIKRKLSSHFPQLTTHSVCNEMKKEYESKKNIKFTNVIILRPDLLILRDKIDIHNDKCYFKRDFARIFPEHIYNLFMSNIKIIGQYMYLVANNNKILGKRFKDDEIYSKRCIYHYLEKTFLEMNDMSEYISFTKFPIGCKWIKT